MTSRDDTTKPSRINRRRKKKWRMAWIDQTSMLDRLIDRIRQAAKNLAPCKPALPAFDIKQDCLTLSDNAAILTLPLTHSAVGIINPFYQGQKMTAPFAVFFRLSCRAALVRFYSVMVDCMGPSSDGPRLDAVLITPCNPPPKDYQLLFGGLSLLSRITAMKTHSTGHQSAQKPTPLFSIYWHRQCLRIGIAGALALRIKRRYPACVVKFVGMEGV